MKKSVVILVIALLTAAGLVGGNYYLGSRIEKEYFKMVAENGQWGPFSLSNVSYERGLLSSKVRTALELADTAESGAEDTNQTTENVKIIFEHTIWSGPLALTAVGGQTKPVPALAVVETRVVGVTPKNEELSAAFAKLPELANSSLLLTVGLDGHLQGEIKIPAFVKDIDGMNIDWGGFTLAMGMSKDRSKLSGSMAMPKLNVRHESDNVTIGAVSGKFDLTEALPLLYLGSSKVSVEGVSSKYSDFMGNPQEVVLKGLDIDAVSKKTGAMVEMAQTMKFANLVAENATYGPAVCTVEFKNLDAQALSDFQVQMRKIYATAGADISKLEGQFEQMMDMYKDLFVKCLKGSPEMRISELRLTTERGNAEGRFAIKFVAPAEITLENPLAMVQHVESSGDIVIQEKLLKAFVMDEVKREMLLMGGEDGGQAFSDAELAKLAAEQFDAQISPLVEQKFVVREGETLKSSATFKAGKLTVNGQDVPLF